MPATPPPAFQEGDLVDRRWLQGPLGEWTRLQPALAKTLLIYNDGIEKRIGIYLLAVVGGSIQELAGHGMCRHPPWPWELVPSIGQALQGRVARGGPVCSATLG